MDERAEIAELVGRLGEYDELPDEVIAKILSYRAAIVPSLIEVLRQDLADPIDSPAPYYAAKALGELKAVEAIEVLLDVIDATEAGEDALFDAACLALTAIGPPVFESLMKRAEAVTDWTDKEQYLDILSEIHVKDERVFRWLVEGLERSLDRYAGSLGAYGDPRALPLLQQKLDVLNYDPSSESPFENHAVFELRHSIEDLGGTLSPSQQKKVARAHLILDRENGHKPMPKIGRNDPCWCGSGKKYKKCHVDEPPPIDYVAD